MKALTVLQPWASLIVAGYKRIENRTWSPQWELYGSEILIHAGKSERELRKMDDLTKRIIADYGENVNDRDLYPLGCLLGVARLDDVVESANAWWWRADQRKYITGPMCWKMTMLERFETPIPWKGAQRVWNVDDRMLETELTLQRVARMNKVAEEAPHV